MRDFKKTFFLFQEPAHAQPAGYFVKAEKPLYERTPLRHQRPPPLLFFTSSPPLHPSTPFDSSSCLCKANSEIYGFKTFMGWVLQ